MAGDTVAAATGEGSAGSQGHPGSCAMPCKYFWKPRGCKEGAKCSRCHLCPWQPQLARAKGAKAPAPTPAAPSAAPEAERDSPDYGSDVFEDDEAEPYGAPHYKAEDEAAEAAEAAEQAAKKPAKQLTEERLRANSLRYQDMSDEDLQRRVPRRADGAVASVGSFLHAFGQCVKCASASTKAGCPNGVRCKFCHMEHRKAGDSNEDAAPASAQAPAASKRKRAVDDVALDALGNSRPSWLLDDDPGDLRRYGYGGRGGGGYGPQYGSHPPPGYYPPPASHYPPRGAPPPHPGYGQRYQPY